MKRVYINFCGQVTFEKTATSTHKANMHCSNPREYQKAAAEANFNAYCVDDIKSMDRDWSYKCSQSPYGGKTRYWFENVSKL